MAGSINVPQNLTRVVELKYTDDLLRRFLNDVASKITLLEEANRALEARVKALEP